MTIGSFPLGSHGCSVGQNGDKQERGSVLESKVRMPTMEDVITTSLLGWDPVDDKILWVEFCLGYSSTGSTD